MRKMHITIDDYYTTSFYNKTIKTLNLNNINFKEYILMKFPFRRIIEIDEKDEPNFIDYKILGSNLKNKIIRTITPKRKDEERYLMRREGMDSYFEKYIIPKGLKNKENIIIFKDTFNNALFASDNLVNNPIYRMPSNKGYLYVSYNKYIINFISPKNIILNSSNGWISSELELSRRGIHIEKSLYLDEFYNGRFYKEY